MTVYKGWGERLRRHHKARGLSARQIAERAGQAESTIRSWINGSRQISLDDFMRLCIAAEADPAEILFEVSYLRSTGKPDIEIRRLYEAWHNADERGKELLTFVSNQVLRRHGKRGRRIVKDGSPER